MAYTPAQEYTAETPDSIRQAVTKVQKRARARLLPDDVIEEIVQDIEARPYGYIKADGGSVAKAYKAEAETTFLHVAWYTWRRKKWITWSVARCAAGKVSYGSSYNVDKNFDRQEAWKRVLRERFIKYLDLKIRRQAKRYGIVLPSDKTFVKIVDCDGGMMLLQPYSGDMILYSPLGYTEIPWYIKSKTVYEAAKMIGIPMPHRKANRTWDKIEAYWVMSTLSKL